MSDTTGKCGWCFAVRHAHTPDEWERCGARAARQAAVVAKPIMISVFPGGIPTRSEVDAAMERGLANAKAREVACAADPSPLAPPVLAEPLTFTVTGADGTEAPMTIASGCYQHAPLGNATCLHCGGPAYAGLVGAECLRPTGCGPAPLPMPDTLTLCAAATEHMAHLLGVPQGEPLWTADGRGCTTRHPIEAEALRLWQEAVAPAGRPRATHPALIAPPPSASTLYADLSAAMDREMTLAILGAGLTAEDVRPEPGSYAPIRWRAVGSR